MKYQLVIQFLGSAIKDYDYLINIEDLLISKLADNNEVDGHDFGNNEMNIYLLTNTPIETYEEIKNIFLSENINLLSINIAYRDLKKEKFTILQENQSNGFIL